MNVYENISELNSITTLIFVFVVMVGLLAGITIIANHYSLNGIKSKTVGDGQYGVARFATKRETKKIYNHIPFNVNQWRSSKGKLEKPVPQGLIIGCEGHKNNVTALVDTNDVHCLMIGASGVGKTAYFLYPNLGVTRS